MFLFRVLFWLTMLPVRLVLWAAGLVLWVAILPVRLLVRLLMLVGLGRILQLAFLGLAGYYLYRLVNHDEGNPAIATPSEGTLNRDPAP